MTEDFNFTINFYYLEVPGTYIDYGIINIYFMIAETLDIY